MSRFTLSRRQFGVSLGAFGLAATMPRLAFAQGATKTITTSAGTYDIPLDPRRVIAVDHRLDLEPALALGLPVIGYSLSDALEPWVPVKEGTEFIGTPPTPELLLSHEPDLIFCTDIPGSEMWPIDRLSAVAPVIPVDYEMSWQDNLLRIGEWMDRSEIAEAFIADYTAQLDALRERIGGKVKRKVAAVWYETTSNEVQFLLGAGTKNVTLAGQVLHDLGGVTVPEEPLGEYAVVSMENTLEIMADVEAVLIDAYTEDQLAAMEASPIWQRVPAVAAGRVYRTRGTFYGGGYSAKRLIGEWEKLYDLLD